MLVISRKKDQGITLGNNIRIRILECGPTNVKIGIDAPNKLSIYRDELYDAIATANREALKLSGEEL